MRDGTRITRRRLVQLTTLVVCLALAMGALIGGSVTAADHPAPRASGPAVASDSGSDPCVPNQAPEASFTVDPTTGVAGQPVTFTSFSTDPDGDPIQLSWDSSDPAFQRFRTDSQFSHTFATPGRYHVLLRVTDSCGETSFYEIFLDVVAPTPATPSGGSPSGGSTPAPDTQPAAIPAGQKATTQRRGIFSWDIGRFVEHVIGTVNFVATNVSSGSAARALRLGRKRFEANPGRVARVKVKLSRKALRALKRQKKLRVRAVISVVDDAGNRSTRTVRFILRAR